MKDDFVKVGECIPSAFPTGIITDDRGIIIGGSNGMSLRDYFAAKAMYAMYVTSFEWESTGIVRDPHHMAIMEEMAKDAYGIADAMLKARET